jgi:hypothetical protein
MSEKSRNVDKIGEDMITDQGKGTTRFASAYSLVAW